mgnify:CR=1 FL=1
MKDLQHLPGADVISRGLEDARKGISSIESLLVWIARPRLIRLGLSIPKSASKEHELQLYQLLGERYPQDSYSRYGSLLRLLTSFSRALEAEQGRSLRSGS